MHAVFIGDEVPNDARAWRRGCNRGTERRQSVASWLQHLPLFRGGTACCVVAGSDGRTSGASYHAGYYLNTSSPHREECHCCQHSGGKRRASLEHRCGCHDVRCTDSAIRPTLSISEWKKLSPGLDSALVTTLVSFYHHDQVLREAKIFESS